MRNKKTFYILLCSIPITAYLNTSFSGIQAHDEFLLLGLWLFWALKLFCSLFMFIIIGLDGLQFLITPFIIQPVDHRFFSFYVIYYLWSSWRCGIVFIKLNRTVYQRPLNYNFDLTAKLYPPPWGDDVCFKL